MLPELPNVDGRQTLLTTEQMAEADRLAAEAGVPGLTLMEAAGRAVAECAADLLAKRGGGASSVAVLCGPGNNGGDGFVAARLLSDQGVGVDVYFAGDVDKLSGDAAHMAAAWQTRGRIRPVAEAADAQPRADLIIDALFGAGLSRPLDGDVADVFDAMELGDGAGGRPVIAVDIPSGVDGNTGQRVGRRAVRADRTVTFFRLKPGHVLLPGRELAGRIVLTDIGIADAVLWPASGETDAGAGLTPARSVFTAESPLLEVITSRDAARSGGDHGAHKYNHGHAVVVSGARHRTGAARLAARAALRVGAGLVTVASPEDAVDVNAAHLTAIMLAPFDGAEGLAQILDDERLNAVALGPGLGIGSPTRDLVAAVLVSDLPRERRSVVLDADALTSFAAEAGAELGAEPGALFEMIGGRQVVLTPHEGEFKRLFPGLEGSKLARARAAAEVSGAVVVLKGPDTVVAAPDGSAAIAANGPPWLATAGSGDVLAGLITGEMARGRDGYGAARAAVWLHGASAQAFGPGLIAEDLPEMVPEVLGA